MLRLSIGTINGSANNRDVSANGNVNSDASSVRLSAMSVIATGVIATGGMTIVGTIGMTTVVLISFVRLL